MAGDAFRTLMSIRRYEVEQARSSLGACLRGEAAAIERIRLAEAAVRRDRETDAAWPDSHLFHEIAAMRLDVVRAERAAAAAALVEAQARSADARDIVTAARTAAEAVAQLIGERRAAAETEATRRAQHALDDIARWGRTVRQQDENGPRPADACQHDADNSNDRR